jgi:protein-L-isoaspartate(D-aspartate) O-methyltransferase
VERFPVARQPFARKITQDPRLQAAFRAVPRERFLNSRLTPTQVYADTTLPLTAEVNNGQPSLHARCLAAVQPQLGERVAHVGAGTGYYTAILAELVGPTGRVHAYEIEPALARRAQASLAWYPQVAVHATSGATGQLPESNLIYVNCGATAPLPVWLEALAPGGRLLFPLTGADGAGAMLFVRKAGAACWPARFLMPVLFVGGEGMRDPVEEAVLTAAFARADLAAVHSLCRATPPDATAWVAGHGWWLAAAPNAQRRLRITPAAVSGPGPNDVSLAHDKYFAEP